VANIRSQIKRNRQNERRRLRNKAVKSEIRTRSKAALTAADYGAEDTTELVRIALKRIDKAAAKGVIHRNQAANRKARLMRRVNELAPADDETEEATSD
jgi:small subunit ribosomal protein S20